MNLTLLISVWSQPWLARKNLYPTKWLGWMFLLVLCSPAILLAFYNQGRDWFAIATVFFLCLLLCLGLLLLYWFISLVPLVCKHYTAANAAIIPKLRQVLRISLLVPLIVIPALIALSLLGLSMEQRLLAYLFSLFFAVVYAAGMRDTRFFYILMLAFAFPVLLTALERISTEINLNLLYLSAGLSVAAVWYFSGWLFPYAAEQVHSLEKNVRQFNRAITTEGASTQVNFGRFYDPYFRYLHKLLAKGQNADKQALASLIFSNLSFSKTTILNTWVLGLPVFILLLFGSGKLLDLDVVLQNSGMLIYFVAMHQTCFNTLIRSVTRSRNEQMLLLLTPQFSAGQLHEIWGSYLLKQFLLVWLSNLLIWIVIVCNFTIQPFSQDLTLIALSSSLLYLPLLLRDYRSMQQVKVSNNFAITLLVLVVTAALCALRYFMQAVSIYAYCCTIALILCSYTYWKWQIYRRHSHFPLAFSAT